MLLLDMPKLTEIDEDGAKALLEALKERTMRDYLIALHYISKHDEPSHKRTEELRNVKICEWFLGESTCNRLKKMMEEHGYEKAD